MTGENISARRLKIINFAPNSAVTDRVIVQMADSATGRIARNCILDDCIFDNSGSYYTGSSVILAKFAAASQSAAHNFCVVRRCFFNGEPNPPPGPDIFPVTAIDPGTGRGFIAEENMMAKVTTGVKTTNNPAIDLIFWNNQMNVVRYGVDIYHNDVGSAAVGRVVVIENAINLARIAGIDCQGIRFLGDPSEQNFNDVIVRKNVIAADPLSSGPTADLFGVTVKNTTNAIVENNVMKSCDAEPLVCGWNAHFKAFNNQKTDGTLVRGYDTINTRYLMELEDFVEDALLGF